MKLPSSSASAGASWSNTISYEQPDYKTFVTNNTDKKVDWKNNKIIHQSSGLQSN
ncbi:leukocidin family pore-forming toxin [Bacillus sp. FJAT-51639]|uniref:Leukocidin family pore-forming toxin n=1 Tax=Bacillus bruguierae TaxID=3127667 RepID=A0ABU8FMU2_9BACI